MRSWPLSANVQGKGHQNLWALGRMEEDGLNLPHKTLAGMLAQLAKKVSKGAPQGDVVLISG